MVTLTAAAASGSTFTGWLGACIGTGPCMVTVSGASTVSATFAANPIVPRLDVDANNQSDALTDGVLIVRYLMGLNDPALTAGAVGPGATRSSTGDRQPPEYARAMTGDTRGVNPDT